MKITLIYPPWSPLLGLPVHPPLVTPTLSAVLEREGYEINALDLNIFTFNRVSPRYKVFWKPDRTKYWADEKLFYKVTYPLFVQKFCKAWLHKILTTNPDIICFSVYYSSKWCSLLISKEIKKYYRNKVIIFGGPECSLWTGKQFLETGNVDVIVIGEGEITLPEVIETIKENKISKPGPGILIKEGGKLKYGGEREPIKNLDKLPFPNFSSLDLKEYIQTSRELILPTLWSRGCLNNCHYCTHNIVWRHYRERSPENIVRELKYLKERYGVTRFQICDSAITWNPKRLERICDYIIKEPLNIKWEAFGRPDKWIDKKLLYKLRDAGCEQLRYGIESGSQKVLDKMGRRTEILHIERVIRDTSQTGIKVLSHFMVGYPGESWIDFMKTLWFILKNRKYFNRILVHYCEVYRGSALYKNPARYGIILGEKISHNVNCWRTRNYSNTYFIRLIRYALIFLLCYFVKEKTCSPNIFVCILNRIKYHIWSHFPQKL